MTRDAMIEKLKHAQVELARVTAYDYTPAVRFVWDDIEAVLAALAAPAQAEPAAPLGWQPIETAPRDRTRVLVHVPFEEGTSYAVQVGRYDLDAGQFVYDDESEGYAKAHPPTHWHPLPSPPAALPASSPAAPEDCCPQCGGGNDRPCSCQSVRP